MWKLSGEIYPIPLGDIESYYRRTHLRRLSCRHCSQFNARLSPGREVGY